MLLKEIEVFEKLEASLKSTKRGNLRKPRSVHAGSNKPRTRDSGFREAPRSTGCLVCGIDRDHTNILLCEGCNGEYHTYCLLPPLKSIPQDDWFCDNCLPDDGDGLEQLVSSLPPNFTTRFAEICWAQGGNGYGWWPCCIYDPRLTVGDARVLARKNLGKKHLVYFFQCEEAPFAVLPTTKIQGWTEGLVDSFYMGKAAKAAGKCRYIQFRKAFQAAIIEESKPLTQRLEWNQLGFPPQASLAARPASPQKTPVNAKKRPTDCLIEGSRTKRAKSSVSLDLARNDIMEKREPARYVETSESGTEMFCKVKRKLLGAVDKVEIGFVLLPCRFTSTFADVRRAISIDLDEELPSNWDWRFYVPPLGPLSIKQESRFGAMLSFLRKAAPHSDIGEGSLQKPAQVVLVDAPQN